MRSKIADTVCSLFGFCGDPTNQLSHNANWHYIPFSQSGANPPVALSKTRPAPFQPGERLGEHFSVEGLVRLSEGRMFYLANDNRPDLATKRCWSCGATDTPTGETHCMRCGEEFKAKRFLISARWDDELFEPYMKLNERNLAHPGLVQIADVFRSGEVLCSVTEWNNETLMVDEGAPLEREQLAKLALRGVGLIAFLQINGVEIAPLTQANFIRNEDGEYKFFDLEISSLHDEPLPEDACTAGIQGLARTLKRFSSVLEVEFGSVLDEYY